MLIVERHLGMQAIGLAIMLQAAFIMGWTKASSPGRVRARRQIRELEEMVTKEHNMGHQVFKHSEEAWGMLIHANKRIRELEARMGYGH